MSYPIIGCPGYSLADDMHTIHNQNGKAVSEENEYVTIVVEGEKHAIQRAKLAWCAMKGVNPFEVSDDDYIFYYSKNTPRKKSTAKISKGTKLNDIEFQKTIKGWAEKNGFFDTKKYLQTMHDFIQRHNISLTGKDDYCVFKQSDKDTILEGMTHAAPDKQENSDKQCMVKLDELEYHVFKNRAKENNMTVDEYVIRLLSCVPYNMDDTKLFNLEKAAEKVNKNLWDYIFDLVFNKDSENDKRQNDLKEQVADLKGAIQQITEELEKKQEALSKCKALASLNALKPILPPMWYVKAIKVTYVNDIDKDSLNVELFNNQNNAMIGDMPEDHTRKKYYEEFSSMSVDHFVNIINDAKQRLLTANNYEGDLSDENIIKDEEYLWNDETSEENMSEDADTITTATERESEETVTALKTNAEIAPGGIRARLSAEDYEEYKRNRANVAAINAMRKKELAEKAQRLLEDARKQLTPMSISTQELFWYLRSTPCNGATLCDALEMSQRNVDVSVSALVKAGLVERVGSRKTGYYAVTELGRCDGSCGICTMNSTCTLLQKTREKTEEQKTSSSQDEFSDDDVIEKFRKDLNHQKDKNGENPEYDF